MNLSVGEHCIAKNGTYESEKKMQWTKINKSNLATREYKERSLKDMPALFVRKGQKNCTKDLQEGENLGSSSPKVP